MADVGTQHTAVSLDEEIRRLPESDPRRNILLAERERQLHEPTTNEVMPWEMKWSPVSEASATTINEEKPWETKWSVGSNDINEEKPWETQWDTTPHPTYLGTAGQALASGVGSLASVAGNVGGFVYDAMGNQKTGDELRQMGQGVKGFTKDLIQTPEEQAARTRGQQITAALVGAAPAVAAGVATGNPLVAFGIMGAQAGDIGTDLIDQGVPLGEAMGAAGVSAALTTALGVVNPTAKSLVGLAVKGAPVNVVIGAAQDKILNSIISNEQIAKGFNWADPDKRIVDAVVGAVMPVGFRIGENLHARYRANDLMNKVNESLYGNKTPTPEERSKFMGDLLDGLQQVADHELGLYKPQVDLAGRTAVDAFWDVVGKGGKLTDAYDIIYQDVDGTFTQPHERALAQKLLERSKMLGLDLVNITPDDPHLQNAAQWRAASQTVAISPKNFSVTPATMLHEGTHAVLAAATDLYRSNPDRTLLGPEQQAVWDRMEGLDKVYQQVLRIKSKQLGLTHEEMVARMQSIMDGVEPPPLPKGVKTTAAVKKKKGPPVNEIPDEMKAEFARRERDGMTGAEIDRANEEALQAHADAMDAVDAANAAREFGDVPQSKTPPKSVSYEHWDFIAKHYGLLDLHEFAAETLTSPEFQKLLQSIPMTATQVQKFGLKRDSKIMNAWDVVKNLVFRIVGGESRSTALDLAMDHALFNVEKTTPATRKEDAWDYARRYSSPESTPVEIQSGIAKHNATMDRLTAEQASPDNPRAKALQTAKDNPVIGSILYRIAAIRGKVLDDPILGFKEFADRVKEEMHSPEWDSFLKDNLRGLFDHPAELKAYAEKVRPTLAEGELRWVSDDRTIEDFAKEELKNWVTQGRTASGEVPAWQDINNFSEKMFNTQVAKMLSGDKVGNKVFRYVYDQAKRIEVLVKKFDARGMAFLKDYEKLSRKDAIGLNVFLEKFNTYKEQKKALKEGKQWLTEDDLRQGGMNDAQIAAYKGLTQMYDDTMDRINIALAHMGKDPLPKVPYFMPNMWEGAYKVKVKSIIVDPKTGNVEREFVSHMYSGNHRWKGGVIDNTLQQFKNSNGTYTKQIQTAEHPSYRGKQHFLAIDFDRRTNQPYYVAKYKDPSNSLLAILQEHMEAYQNSLQLAPETMQILERVESEAAVGLMRHAMERSNVGGFAKIIEGDSLLNRRHNTRVIEEPKRYLEAVNDYYGSTIFHSEVMAPLFDTTPNAWGDPNAIRLGAIFAHNNHLLEWAKNFEKNFSGNNTNYLSLIDGALEKTMIKMGLSPHVPKQTIRAISSVMYGVLLTPNIPFHAANYLQPVHMGHVLNMVDARRVAEGNPPLNVSKAMLKGGAMDYNPTYMKEAVDWAKFNHVLEAQMTHELGVDQEAQTIDPQYKKLETATGKVVTLGNVISKVERIGRERSFRIAYEYFRQIHGDTIRAREAAAEAMNLGMVDYSRKTRAPIFQNTGIVGEFFSPFASYGLTYMGLFAESAKMLAKDGILGKNPRAALPLLTYMGTFLAMAGLQGMPLKDEWDAFARMVGTFSPDVQLGSLYEHSMRLADALNMPRGMIDAMNFGFLGATGLNVSSSMGGSLFASRFASPVWDFASSLAKLATSPKDPEARYAALRSVVPSTIWKMADMDKGYQDNPEVGLKSGSLTGWSTRTPADRTANMVGFSTTRESNEKLALAADANEEKARNALYKTTIQRLVASSRGETPAVSHIVLMKKALELSGKGYDEVVQDIIAEMEDRNLSQIQKLAKSQSITSQQRLQDILRKTERYR